MLFLGLVSRYVSLGLERVCTSFLLFMIEMKAEDRHAYIGYPQRTDSEGWVYFFFPQARAIKPQ